MKIAMIGPSVAAVAIAVMTLLATMAGCKDTHTSGTPPTPVLSQEKRQLAHTIQITPDVILKSSSQNAFTTSPRPLTSVTAMTSATRLVAPPKSIAEPKK